MAKLHELLAVKDATRTQAETTRADLINTFTSVIWKFVTIAGNGTGGTQ